MESICEPQRLQRLWRNVLLLLPAAGRSLLKRELNDSLLTELRSFIMFMKIVTPKCCSICTTIGLLDHNGAC